MPFRSTPLLFPCPQAPPPPFSLPCRVRRALPGRSALFVFGSYTIGKERVFLEAARALGERVYMAKAKAALLAECGLSSEYRALITTDHLDTCVHAVRGGRREMG